jgi:hypothetical protein
MHDRDEKCMGRRDVEEAFRSWYSKKDTKKIKDLPLT